MPTWGKIVAVVLLPIMFACLVGWAHCGWGDWAGWIGGVLFAATVLRGMWDAADKRGRVS